MGLISTASNPNRVVDPLLRQAQAGIEAKIPAELKPEYLRIIIAGLKVMFMPQTEHLMAEKFKAAGNNLVPAVADGISDLMLIIYKQSGRRASIPAMAPAAVVLMFHALDFAEQALHVQVTKDMIAECTQATIGAFFRKFRLNPNAQAAPPAAAPVPPAPGIGA